ncbi:MAG: hypothetical protein ACOC8E_01750, partial [Planctomycetota bacterium]
DDGGAVMPEEPIEIDEESGAEIYLLGADERPADNIYGEQPYSDPQSRRIAIRYYSGGDLPGGIEIFDLYDGSRHEVLSGKPPFPAFHPWSEWLYYRQTVDGVQMLRRCNYLTMEIENVAPLPPERGAYSYGTISPDHRWYAVAVMPEGAEGRRVDLLDIQTGEWRVLLDKEGYHAKHEQFSRDGRNKVLIQLNEMPDVEHVLLGEIDLSGELKLFPADEPHTLRPTGHEAWIGDTSSIFFSTRVDPDTGVNIYTGAVGDEAPTPVPGPGGEEGCRIHWSMMHEGQIMLRDDSAMNFSPAMFDEFIRPYGQRLLDEFGGGAVHFCGKGDHYIHKAVEMDDMHAIAMSQPEYNDMEEIYRSTVDRGIKLIGLRREAAEAALAAGRDLHGCVHCW